MAEPLRAAYQAMPEPRLVAALGDCALGCGVLADPAELAGPLDAILPVDLQSPAAPQPRPRSPTRSPTRSICCGHERRRRAARQARGTARRRGRRASAAPTSSKPRAQRRPRSRPMTTSKPSRKGHRPRGLLSRLWPPAPHPLPDSCAPRDRTRCRRFARRWPWPTPATTGRSRRRSVPPTRPIDGRLWPRRDGSPRGPLTSSPSFAVGDRAPPASDLDSSRSARAHCRPPPRGHDPKLSRYLYTLRRRSETPCADPCPILRNRMRPESLTMLSARRARPVPPA